MNKKGPIIFIEDDLDDQDILKDIFSEFEYKNKVIFFSEGEKALEFLIETRIKPFIIFSDINMPKLNGMELRDKIQENKELEIKSIPYLFFTTSSEQKQVIEAYSKSVQGFFVKPSNYNELKKVLTIIIEYWQHCKAPEYTG